MTSKDLLQSLKDNLERESAVDVTDVDVKIRCSGEITKATVAKFVDGKWQMFEVLARPMGFSETLDIGA